MKRYRINYKEDTVFASGPTAIEHLEGEWVRYKDVIALSVTQFVEIQTIPAFQHQASAIKEIRK